MMYECDDSICLHKGMCQNRMFTNAHKKAPFELVVKDELNKGKDIMVNECILSNDCFVGEYTGKIISENTRKKLLKQNPVGSARVSYFLLLCIAPKTNMEYYIDAFDHHTSSILRYVDHSCTPNCKIVVWLVQGMPRIGL